MSTVDADRIEQEDSIDPSRYLLLWEGAGMPPAAGVPSAGPPMRRTASLGAYSTVNMTTGGYTLAQTITDEEPPRQSYAARLNSDPYGEARGQFYDIGQSRG